MAVSIVEALRKYAVSDVLAMGSMAGSWPQWRNSIHTSLGLNPSGQSLINIGDSLSDIFRQTGQAGRSQGSVSGGGYAWEGLVTWYLNVVSANSRMVAIKMKKDLVPEAIRDAITVSYGNIQCNTEADIIVIVFPQEIYDITVDESVLSSRRSFARVFADLEITELDEFKVGVVQCKTNWNDNAQIPMLWNMVYSANNFTNTQMSVGANTRSIEDFESFTYSFVTVPSNSLENFNVTSQSVLRVRTLSGGNYWGHPTAQGVSSSIKEIFNRNFRSAFTGSISQTATTNLGQLNSSLSYFDL